MQNQPSISGQSGVDTLLTSKTFQLRTAAVFGFAGVALGAFGAHGLAQRLEALDRVETWETAVLYHLVHAIMMVFTSQLKGRTGTVFGFFTAGILIFSGSLYILSLTDWRILGAVTPLGGVSFLIAWFLLGWKAKEFT